MFLKFKQQSERHQLLKQLTSQFGKYYHSQYVESPDPTSGKKVKNKCLQNPNKCKMVDKNVFNLKSKYYQSALVYW